MKTKFKKGDKVRLREDALVQHARSVPAHMGYTLAQFSWRDRLRSLAGELGVVSDIYGSHCNVDFNSGMIGIDAGSIELATTDE